MAPQGTATVPPVPTDPSQALAAEPDTWRTKLQAVVSRLSGGGTPAIDAALQQHYARQKAGADLASQQVQTLAHAYYAEQDPQKKQALAQQWEVAKEQYLKSVGKDKNAKGIAQKMIGLTEHVIGHQPQQPAAAGGGGGGGGGGAGAAAGPRGQTVTPPPTQGRAPQPQQGAVPPPPGLEMMTAPYREKELEEKDELRQKTNLAGGEAEAKAEAAIKGARVQLTETGKTAGMSDQEAAVQANKVIMAKYGGAGMRATQPHGHPVLVADPDDPTKQIFGIQSTTPDENGAYLVRDTDGNVISNPRKLLTPMLPTERTGEMPVFNPVTNTIEQQPTYSTSHKVAPKGGSGGGGDRAGKPYTGGAGGGAGGGGGGGSSKGSPQPGSGGRHGIPMRQFGPLQKQATAIDEARNSLVGDDPQKVGGLAADLGVFKSPQSVKRISEYLALVNTQVANEAKTITGQGPMAAVEWYTTLPQTVIGLEQGALADASKGLSPPEQRFVADYYRALGTIGGMRAATGASSAQWSFNTLRSELPTPGPVTSPEEAARRVHNFIKETNVVAKRNPLLKTVPDVPTGGGEYIYAKGPDGVVHRAKKGTPLRQGFTLVDAPTAAK